MIEKISTSYNSYSSIDELTTIDKKLLKKAEKFLEQSYSVYSGFSVGAAALLDSGEIIASLCKRIARILPLLNEKSCVKRLTMNI